MPRAYVLIRIEPGREKEVIEQLETVEEIKSADLVTGRYDAIVLIEADDVKTITEAVMGKIRIMRGVIYTESCLAVI
jgi:DNA-binding Lrp family transcriptional regulator